MERAERERLLKEVLDERDWDRLQRIPASAGWLLRRLSAHMQRAEPLRRWRALEALGIWCRKMPADEEILREFLRSLFWSMNDESGNLFRMAPEAIGELLLAKPKLRDEYASLLPQFLNEEPFEAGTLWALCRLVDDGWQPCHLAANQVTAGLTHPDPRHRGLSIRLSRKIGLPWPSGLTPERAVFESYDFLSGQLILASEPPESPCP
jgi:hypothetical protein